jgi:hypothetical protein
MGVALRIMGGVFAVSLFAAGAAAAADPPQRDPTGRFDVNDLLQRHASEVSELPTGEETAGRPVTFNLSLTGTFTTNAGTTPSEVTTGYGTPSLSVNVTPVAAGGWQVGGGAQVDGDYYSGGDFNRRFGESRLEAFAFSERSIGPGTFTAEVIYFAAFDTSFSDNFFNLLIGDLDYSVKSGPFTADVSATYEGSEAANLRRGLVTGTLAYTVPQKVFGHEIAVEGEARFVNFTSGTNTGRNDAYAGVLLTAERKLGSGWSLEWEGAFLNRFSNREISRFDDVELGVEFSKRF